MRKLSKPTLGKIRTGFQPVASGLNTSGARARIPHDKTAGSRVGYEWKLRVANVRAPKGRKMY